jgi:hypothetical protein
MAALVLECERAESPELQCGDDDSNIVNDGDNDYELIQFSSLFIYAVTQQPKRQL